MQAGNLFRNGKITTENMQLSYKSRIMIVWCNVNSERRFSGFFSKGRNAIGRTSSFKSNQI